MFVRFVSIMFFFGISFQVQSQSSQICLGDSSLCEKRYDEITFLTTHNSFNYGKRGKNKKTGPHYYLFPNQELPIEDQLIHGVRAFMLDLHLKNEQVILCHGGKGCGILGHDPIEDIFTTIKIFLEKNPTEIISLILESYVPTSKLKKALDSTGLSSFLHCQSQESAWPKIIDMIQSKKDPEKHDPNCKSVGRLVILNDRVEKDDPAWNLDLFGKFSFETHYAFRKIRDLNCKINRGNENHSLYIFNHFTTFISGKKSDAITINKKDFLMNRIKDCEKNIQKKINFLTIDYFNSGESIFVVNHLNGITKEYSE